MKTRMILPVLAAMAFSMPALVGCEETVTTDREVDVKKDGTVVKEETKVTEQPDGTVKKTETKSVDRPNND